MDQNNQSRIDREQKISRDLKSRFETLKNAKSYMENLYKEISDLLFPYNNNKRTMWDSGSAGACIKLASLLHNLITPFGGFFKSGKQEHPNLKMRPNRRSIYGSMN